MSSQEVLSLVYQIVDGAVRNVKSNDEGKGIDGILTEINRITSPWQNTGEETTAAPRVMFALDPDTSGWSAAGVNPSELPTWELIGFTPEYTQRWTEAGLTLQHAMKWSSTYALKSFDPERIADWERSGFATDINAVLPWMRISASTERAVEWLSLGGSFHTGRNWLCAYPEIAVDALYATSKLGLGVSQARRWFQKGIFGDDIAAFIEKGHTPASARKHLDGGGTPSDAPDKRNGEPIPGRSWKAIASAIKNNPKLSYSVSKNINSFGVTVQHSDHSEKVDVSLWGNGQFNEALANVKVQRTLSGGSWTSRRTLNLSQLLEHLQNWK